MEECGNISGIQVPASWPMQEAARPTLPSSGHATHPTPRLALRWHHRGPPRGAVFQRALARLACWDVVPGLCFRLLGVFARPHWPRIADCLADIYSASLAGSWDHAGV